MALLGDYQCATDEIEETFLRVATIVLLAARLASLDEDLVRVGQALAGERAQSRLHVIAQCRIARQRESQLHGRRHLVDVLPAGTGRADEGHFEIGVRNLEARSN